MGAQPNPPHTVASGQASLPRTEQRMRQRAATGLISHKLPTRTAQRAAQLLSMRQATRPRTSGGLRARSRRARRTQSRRRLPGARRKPRLT